MPLTPEAAANRVEMFFAELERDVFSGDPAANPALHVEVVDTREVAGGIVVSVVAPWTITAVLLFDDGAFPEMLVVAGRRLPVLTNEVPSLGPYRSVTLVRGVETMRSQDEARRAVTNVLDAFIDAVARAREGAQVENPSRRRLFRSLAGDDES